MFLKQLQNVLALQQEGHFFGLDELIMIGPCPPAFLDSRDVHRIDAELFFLPKSILSDKWLASELLFEGLGLELVVVNRQLFDFVDNKLFLPLDNLTDLRIVDCWVHIALHHRPSLVVFYVAFPSFRGHTTVLAKPLFAEIT